MNTKIIKRDSLSKQVSDKLESMIESGAYQVGERIPTEPELMEMFQVSRNTVREADVTSVKVGDSFSSNAKYELVVEDDIIKEIRAK